MKIKSGYLPAIFILLIFSACSSNAELNRSALTVQASQTPLPAATNTPTKTAQPPTPTFALTNTPFPTRTPLPTPITYVEPGLPLPQPEAPITSENAAQLVELARWGYGAINQVEFSADGRLMLVQTSRGVYAYRSGTLDLVWQFDNDTGATAIAVSPANDWVFVGTYAGEIYQLDIATGKIEGVLQAHEGHVNSIAVSQDGTFLASGGEDKVLRLWPIPGGNNHIWQIQFTSHFYEIFFIKDSLTLGVITVDSVFQLLSVEKGDYIYLTRDYSNISPTNDLYFDIFNFGTITNRSYISTIQRPDHPANMETSKKFSPKGNYLAIGTEADIILVYRVKDGSLVHIFDPFNFLAKNSTNPGILAKPIIRSGPGRSSIYTMDFSDDEKFLVAANGLGDLFLLNVESGEVQRVLHGKGKHLKFLPGGREFIYYSEVTLELYQVPSGERTAEIWEGWQDTRVLFSPGGTRLASGARLWELETGTIQYAPPGEKILNFSENGNYVYTLRRQWWVTQRRTADLELQRQVALERSNEKKLTTNLSFDLTDLDWWEMGGWSISPDGSIARAASWESPNFFWNLDAGGFYEANEVFNLGIPEISLISRDSRYIINLKSNDVEVWEKNPQDKIILLFHLELHSGVGKDLILGQNDLLYVVSTTSIKSFNLPDGQLLASFTLGGSHVAGAVSPDGKIMAISTGTSILIGDLEQETILYQVQTHFDWIASLAFSPDGRYLATASRDGTVRIWGIP